MKNGLDMPLNEEVWYKFADEDIYAIRDEIPLQQSKSSSSSSQAASKRAARAHTAASEAGEPTVMAASPRGLGRVCSFGQVKWFMVTMTWLMVCG